MTPQRSDSLRTQALLISTAERLFAERGIDGVSLSEINRVAGQRNKSALHYHFGSRDGLLKALLEKHRHRIDAQRAQMLDQFESPETLTLHQALTILVQPLAARLDDYEGGGVYYIRIMAQLSANPQHPLTFWLFNETPSAMAMLAPTVSRHMPPAPAAVRMRRTQLLNATMFHALLLQSHTSDSPSERPLFINDLVDSLGGLVTAPLSDASKAAIAQYEINLSTTAGVPMADEVFSEASV